MAQPLQVYSTRWGTWLNRRQLYGPLLCLNVVMSIVLSVILLVRFSRGSGWLIEDEDAVPKFKAPRLQNAVILAVSDWHLLFLVLNRFDQALFREAVRSFETPAVVASGSVSLPLMWYMVYGEIGGELEGEHRIANLCLCIGLLPLFCVLSLIDAVLLKRWVKGFSCAAFAGIAVCLDVAIVGPGKLRIVEEQFQDTCSGRPCGTVRMTLIASLTCFALLLLKALHGLLVRRTYAFCAPASVTLAVYAPPPPPSSLASQQNSRAGRGTKSRLRQVAEMQVSFGEEEVHFVDKLSPNASVTTSTAMPSPPAKRILGLERASGTRGIEDAGRPWEQQQQRQLRHRPEEGQQDRATGRDTAGQHVASHPGAIAPGSFSAALSGNYSATPSLGGKPLPIPDSDSDSSANRASLPGLDAERRQVGPSAIEPAPTAVAIENSQSTLERQVSHDNGRMELWPAATDAVRAPADGSSSSTLVVVALTDKASMRNSKSANSPPSSPRQQNVGEMQSIPEKRISQKSEGSFCPPDAVIFKSPDIGADAPKTDEDAVDSGSEGTTAAMERWFMPASTLFVPGHGKPQAQGAADAPAPDQLRQRPKVPQPDVAQACCLAVGLVPVPSRCFSL